MIFILDIFIYVCYGGYRVATSCSFAVQPACTVCLFCPKPLDNTQMWQQYRSPKQSFELYRFEMEGWEYFENMLEYTPSNPRVYNSKGMSLRQNDRMTNTQVRTKTLSKVLFRQNLWHLSFYIITYVFWIRTRQHRHSFLGKIQLIKPHPHPNQKIRRLSFIVVIVVACYLTTTSYLVFRLV